MKNDRKSYWPLRHSDPSGGWALAVDPAREDYVCPTTETLQQFIFQISTENVFNESPKHGVCRWGWKPPVAIFHPRCSGNPLETSSYVNLTCSIYNILRNKTRVPTFTTTIQHSCGSFGHSNQSRKRNKRNPNWKKEVKLSLFALFQSLSGEEDPSYPGCWSYGNIPNLLCYNGWASLSL